MEQSLLIGVIFFIGFFCLILCSYFFYKSRKTNSWSSTIGEVMSSEVECSGYIGDDGNRSFKAKVVYQYFVEGKGYISKRVFYGDRIEKPFSKKALRISGKYKKGDEVMVYYDPFCPKDSVIEKGTKIIVLELFILGCIFLFFGVVIMKYNLFL